MLQTYKKKSSRLSWSMENMKQAVDAVLSKTAGYRKAAHLYSVPQTTLERHDAKIRKGELSLDSTPGNFKPVFSKQEEEELVRYIIEMEESLFGLTTIAIRKLAYQLAEKMNQIKLNKKNFEAIQQYSEIDPLHTTPNELQIQSMDIGSDPQVRKLNTETESNAELDPLCTTPDELQIHSMNTSVNEVEATINVELFNNDIQVDICYIEGKGENVEDEGLGYNMVMKLCDNLPENTLVAFDNFFTSCNLQDDLYHMKIFAFGTVRTNRKDLPNITQKAQPKNLKLQKHQFTSITGKPITAIKWLDTRDVTVLTARHPTDVLFVKRTK
ncbi:unnamed protein product [Parnassius mnemosyne]|uniref:HTH psq-type domain-containing protein n=1 Tax=Parnassius mnemosyne TaxID=213953 RepID=A0AAV1L509_9NEOP